MIFEILSSSKSQLNRIEVQTIVNDQWLLLVIVFYVIDPSESSSDFNMTC